MEKTNKELIYCGEIIDRSWFDDPEAYEAGTYEAILVTYSGSDMDTWSDELYQAILRNDRVYLDEYPQCIRPTQCLLENIHYGVCRHFVKRFMRRD